MNTTCLPTVVLALTLGSGCVTAEELVIDHDGQTLAGTLLTVDDPSAPLAVIAAGSGPTDRDGNQAGMQNDSLEQLAEALAGAGIASFRYDKRGIGASRSDMPESELRIQHFAGDLAAIARDIKARHTDRPVFLIGHSEGALLALMAAAEAPVAGVVAIAGPGRPAAEIIHEQLAARTPAALFETADEIMNAIQRGETVTDVPPPLLALFRPSVQPYLRSWFALDPRQVATALDVPVLVVQGTTDIQVNRSDACRLAGAGEHVRVLFIEGMNHVLKEAQGGMASQSASYTDPTLPLHSHLLKPIVELIRGSRPGTPECPSVTRPDPVPGAECDGGEAFAGDWSGTLTGAGIRIVFHLAETEDGCLSGTFDSPDQGGFGLPLSAVEVDGDQLLVRADAFGFEYRATRTGKNSIDGTFVQGGAQLPLALSKP